MQFDSLKFFRRVAWVVVAAGVGVATVAQDVDWQSVDLTWVAIAPIVWGAIRAGAGWYVKKTGASGGFWKLLVVPLVAGLALSGCAGFGGTGLWRPAVGDHSQTKIEFGERLADGTETTIKFTASGEAAATAGVQYTGQTDSEIKTPWALSVTGDTSVTSPQALAVAQGYAVLLEKTPETIAELATQIGAIAGLPDDAAGGASLKEILIRFVLERAAGLLPGLIPGLSP